MTHSASNNDNMSPAPADVNLNSSDNKAVADILQDIHFVGELFESSQKNIHYFMLQSFRYGLVDQDKAISIFNNIIASAEDRLNQIRRTETRLIGQRTPKLIHRIWLSKPSRPVEPPEHYVTSLIEEAIEYGSHGWSCWFWLQNVNILPNTVSRITTEAPCVKILQIENQLPSDGWERLYQCFLDDCKFPFAADILRMKILYEFGGLYADMGARFRSLEITESIINIYDYAFIFWDTMFFQNSLMVMPPGNKVAELFLQICCNPYTLAKGMIMPLSGISEGMAFSGLMITSILLNIYSEEMRICPLASNERSVYWSSEQSWYTDIGNNEGKYGNTFVPKSHPSFFKLEKFNLTEDCDLSYARLFK